MKRLLFENLGLKISAVLISVLLWLFVTSRGQSEMSHEIPVEFKDVPVGLGIASTSAKMVNVAIRGQERVMKNIRPTDLRVFVDLSKAKKGEWSFHISQDDVKLPYAMTVLNIEPSTLRVKLDETMTKPVTVNPVITGTPGKGFYVKAVEVEPKSIVIQGLKAEVRKIGEIRTETMDISGIEETVTQELNVEAGGANIKPEKDKVRVTVVIGGKK
ncbi:MAG: YbbR-like domain-containing protein [Thermodesulfovibrionales bacterium]